MTALKLLLEVPPAAPPDATVLMPLYNSAGMVAEAIASVLEQRGCILDILVSDDRSDDASLAEAEAVTAAYSGPHGLRLFAAGARLGIDHLHQLIDRAVCRIVVEAHGDDVSRPGRMARLLEIFHQTGAALVVSLADLRREKDDLVPVVLKPENRPGWQTLEQCVPPMGNGLFGGARYAFDRIIHDLFPRLDSRLIPSSHDRLQAFRAGLLGRLWLTEERLLVQGVHPQQGSMALVDQRDRVTADFGWSLRHLSALRAMQGDAAYAREHGIVDDERYAMASALLTAATGHYLQQLLDSRDALVRSGDQVRWVPHEELHRLNVSARRMAR